MFNCDIGPVSKTLSNSRQGHGRSDLPQISLNFQSGLLGAQVKIYFETAIIAFTHQFFP